MAEHVCHITLIKISEYWPAVIPDPNMAVTLICIYDLDFYYKDQMFIF